MESSISPLAKRLAEENNVSWHLLEGSGPSGRVVERDVLEYLARVMSGEAATDPVLEPLPEGVDTWPEDIDVLDTVNHLGEQNVTTEDEFGEALLELDAFEDALEFPPVDGARAGSVEPEEDLTGFNFTEALSDDIFVTDELEDDFGAGYKNTHDMDVDGEGVYSSNVYEAGTHKAGVHEADAYKVDNLPEEMLFGDESAGTRFGASAKTPAGDFGAFESEDAEEDASTDAFDVGGLEAEPLEAEARKAGTSEAEAFDTKAFDTEAFEPELFEPETHASDVSPAEADADVFLFDAPPTPDTSFSRDAGFIEDEGSTDSSEARAFGGESDEVGDEEAFGAEDAPEAQEDDAFEFEGLEGASEAYSETSGESAPVPQEFARAFMPELDPKLDDRAASTENELDSSGRAEAASPTSDSAPPAPALPKADGLPNGVPVAPYVLLRRHLDLAALLETQRAIGLEVNGEVPPTAFLLRAALKALHRVPLAASSAEPSEAAVALAVVSADALRVKIVPDVDASFVTLLEMVDTTQQDAAQEDDVPADLIVADMSRYSLDEVMLNLSAPVLALSRVGAAEDSMGALSLSGDVAPSWGAEFLTCVAELLASPVRLLI